MIIKGGAMMKVWNETWEFGEIIAEEDGKVLVRFDADPWYPRWMPKED